MTAETSIADIEATAEEVAEATAHEMRLEDERPLVKAAAIQRIMQGANPLTGKAHSASSAADVVEQDAAYAAHREQQREIVVRKIRAWAQYEAAKLRAQLAVATEVGRE